MTHEHCHGPKCGGTLDAGSVDRRGFMRWGLGAALGLSIHNWQALAAAPPKGTQGMSCILLWMNGGPSHIDTFDPKPGRTTGGEFKAIKTSIPGVQFSEVLPQLADEAKNLVVIRSMTGKEGNHERGQYMLHTGYAPSGTVAHPSLGSWVSRELGDQDRPLPNFVSIRGPSFGAGFFGVEHNPFVIQQPGAAVPNLDYARNVDSGRFDRRLEALGKLQSRFAQKTGDARIGEHDAIYQRAVKLMRTPDVSAFDIASETEATKQAYGENDFGRGCLMARRLVESGVRFVEVVLDGWDTHVDNFNAIRNLAGQLDPAMATLIRDLRDRKMLDRTLVVWMGEFGRTPTITASDGRDHHPAAWSGILAGAGVPVGKVLGATDDDGAKVVRDPVSIPDYFATVATLLGMDPAKSELSPIGRPISLSDNGKPIRSLLPA